MSQAVVTAQYESGIINLSKYCTGYTPPQGEDKKGNYYNASECGALIMKQFKTTGKRCSYDWNKIYNYNKSQSNAQVDIGASARPSYLLADGTCVDVTVNASTIGLSVDINGNKKGPNALGHDIFSFWINSNDMLVPIKSSGYLNDDDLQSSFEKCGTDDAYNSSCASGASQKGYPCSRSSTQRGNGLGCSWFALNDISPDDETKGYWESLPR